MRNPKIQLLLDYGLHIGIYESVKNIQISSQNHEFKCNHLYQQLPFKIHQQQLIKV
jgi:hypothetical protein